MNQSVAFNVQTSATTQTNVNAPVSVKFNDEFDHTTLVGQQRNNGTYPSRGQPRSDRRQMFSDHCKMTGHNCPKMLQNSWIPTRSQASQQNQKGGCHNSIQLY